MLNVTDLRNGTYFQENGIPFEVLKYEHIKMGRGTATVKIKVKNLRTGAQTEKTFESRAKVEEAPLSKKKAQYLYKTESEFFFMDTVSFEQFSLPQKVLAEKAPFLKEGMEVTLLSYNDEPLSIDIPLKMVFKVAETGPSFKGNSVSNILKQAVLENGLKIKVPLFAKEGDLVLVDTRNGEYVERV